MSCGVGYTRGSDPTLLWLRCGPLATAPIRPLAWGPPYDMGAAQEMVKKKKKKVSSGFMKLTSFGCEESISDTARTVYKNRDTHIYVYKWVTLLYSRNGQNAVNTP